MKRALLIVMVAWPCHGYNSQLDELNSKLDEQNRQLRDINDNTDRVASAEEERNTQAMLESLDMKGPGNCPGLEGGGVPEGCELKFMRTAKNTIATIEGADGRRHAVYVLYCPSNQ